jgi:hypothetical protein
MSDDMVAAITAATIVLLAIGLIGLYWRQRLRFTREGLSMPCSLHRHGSPAGLLWSRGILKLRQDELAWRRHWSFRTAALLTVQRSTLALRARRRARWHEAMWMSGADVLALATSAATLELLVQPDDAELLLDWLGTRAERPPARWGSRTKLALWLAYLLGGTLLVGFRTGWAWAFPAVIGAAAVVGLVGGIAVGIVRTLRNRRRLLNDEFVSSVRETFAFLEDFGFPDVYAQQLPWKAVVAFLGTGDRIVTVTLDRRANTLELELGQASSGDRRPLRDVLAEASHPDPDRVRRYKNEDGPVRAALQANAHALRLWGRSFLVQAGEPAGASPKAP